MCDVLYVCRELSLLKLLTWIKHDQRSMKQREGLDDKRNVLQMG